MSKAPRLAPVPAAVAEYPMTPHEARDFARLLEQRAQIDRALEGIGAQAKARLGLAVEAKVEIDLGAAVYRVRA